MSQDISGIAGNMPDVGDQMGAVGHHVAVGLDDGGPMCRSTASPSRGSSVSGASRCPMKKEVPFAYPSSFLSYRQ